jgi:hypothetical protein
VGWEDQEGGIGKGPCLLEALPHTVVENLHQREKCLVQFEALKSTTSAEGTNYGVVPFTMSTQRTDVRVLKSSMSTERTDFRVLVHYEY